MHDEMTDSVMDSDHVSQRCTDSFTGGELFSSARKSDSVSSSSSSSLRSFDAEYLQVDENKPNDDKSDTNISLPTELALKEEANEVHTDEASTNIGEACQISSWSEQTASGAPPEDGESDSGSPGSESPIGEESNSLLESSQIPNEIHSDSEDSNPAAPASISTPQGESVLQSPGIQTMERPEENGTYRIPASVFEPTTSSPAEWSVTSNESLFSIHVGNNSFSKEQFFMMYKSGELGKSGESSYQYKYEEPLLSSNPQYPVLDPGKKSFDMGENLGVEEAAAETMKEVLREAAENQNKSKAQRAEGTLKSSSRHSDMSGTSNASFAFPILTEDATKKSASLKVDPEQQTPKEQPKSQSTRVCPNACATVTNWFSWVPARCRFCC